MSSSSRSSSPRCLQQNLRHESRRVRPSDSSKSARLARTTLKVETPEVDDSHCETGSTVSEANEKTVVGTPVRPILYHTCSRNAVYCGDTADDNNTVADDDGVVFYNRLDSPGDSDDENNRETLRHEAPRKYAVATRTSRQSSAAHDMRLESIKSSSDEHNQHLFEGIVEHSQLQQDDEPEDAGDATAQGNQGGDDSAQCASICCDLLVQYELDSVTKSDQQRRVLSRFARRVRTTSREELLGQTLSPPERSLFRLRSDDGDNDLVNICSPVAQRAGGVGADSGRERRESNSRKNDDDITPSRLALHLDGRGHRRADWTSDQLLQYNDVLDFLHDACATRSREIAIPGERLAQMAQLLRSLHPTVHDDTQAAAHPSR